MMLTIVTGALAGLVHVLAGPDHLTAVAPLAMTGRRRGWMAGWTWGIGHALGVVVVAVLAVVLRDQLPPIDALSLWGERLVGAALIGVGLWALRRSLHIGARPHAHGRWTHGHLHVQRGPRWLQRIGHAHASFCVGILHGVAGSSHFFGVLPALALPTPAAALTYIGAFGAGTVTAMTIFAGLAGFAGARFGTSAVTERALMLASAAAAFAVGGIWLLT